ncbi:MAG: hypothetical protein M1371_10345 [Actinobacteria bacterium]|nr:hypothetical protein [Actinomycetota bacterium]
MEIGEDFLLKEYGELWSDLRHNENLSKSYFNFFIILFTSILGLISGFISYRKVAEPSSTIVSTNNQNLFYILVLFLIVSTIFYGTLLLFIHLKNRRTMIQDIWQINSIRKFYLLKNNKLKDFLHFSIENYPKVYKKNSVAFLTLNVIVILDAILYSLMGVFILEIENIKRIIEESKIILFKNIQTENYIFLQLSIFFLIFIIIYFIYLFAIVKRMLIKAGVELEERVKNMPQKYLKTIKDYKNNPEYNLKE